MKKLITITVALFLITSSYAQYFDGVFIGGRLDSFIYKFKKKGFRLEINDGTSFLYGKVAMREVQILVFATPYTNKVYKISVYMPEHNSWYSLKSDYFSYLDILKNKYGLPTESYSTFIDPYYEGDGFEEQAVKMDKTLYEAIWIGYGNTNIAVSISKYMQVKLIYENIINVELFKKEMQKTHNNSF